MSERLLHYSYKRIDAVCDTEQREPDRKPRGLWLSVEDGWGWRDWCSAENFQGGWRYAYEVRPFRDANILRLSSPWDIDRFHMEYGVFTRWSTYPDWQAVAALYDGIIIAPYQYARRLDGEAHDWYYSWDCSSGCIWRARAVASITDVSARELSGAA